MGLPYFILSIADVYREFYWRKFGRSKTHDVRLQCLKYSTVIPILIQTRQTTADKQEVVQLSF